MAVSGARPPLRGRRRCAPVALWPPTLLGSCRRRGRRRPGRRRSGSLSRHRCRPCCRRAAAGHWRSSSDRTVSAAVVSWSHSVSVSRLVDPSVSLLEFRPVSIELALLPSTSGRVLLSAAGLSLRLRGDRGRRGSPVSRSPMVSRLRRSPVCGAAPLASAVSGS